MTKHLVKHALFALCWLLHGTAPAFASRAESSKGGRQPVASVYPVFPGPDRITIDYPLALEKFFDSRNATADVNLPEVQVKQLLQAAATQFKSNFRTSKLRHLTLDEKKSVINIVGDLHGQFFDLLEIFKEVGHPSTSNSYLFNGDYVDRGSYGVEVMLTLLAWQLALPENVHLNRGNHEYTRINEKYGFKSEVIVKYGESIYDSFSEVFKYLPMAHVIAGKVFVVHGGVPTYNQNIKAINTIEPESYRASGIAQELMWNDPRDDLGEEDSHRGAGSHFGPDVTAQFLKNNKLTLVIRSHELRRSGWSMDHPLGREGWSKKGLVTVFSAANYIDKKRNDAAVLKVRIKNGQAGWDAEDVVTLRAAPHPSNYKPAGYYDAEMAEQVQKHRTAQIQTTTAPQKARKIKKSWLRRLFQSCTSEEDCIRKPKQR